MRGPKPDLGCCKPFSRAAPSGYQWVHSKWCGRSDRRGRAVEREDLAWTRRGPNETALRTWLRHPSGCGCEVCAYFDAHLDDEDDTLRRGDAVDRIEQKENEPS